MSERTQAMARAYVEEGLTYEQIAQQHGVSRQRVGQLLGPLSLAPAYGPSRKATRVQRLRAAFERVKAGETTLDEEAKELGYKNGHTLRHALYKIGLRFTHDYGEPPHGTYARYRSRRFRCRCAECRWANRERMRGMLGQEPPEHGTYSAYINFGCRCRDCKEANRLYLRAQKAAKRQEGVPA